MKLYEVIIKASGRRGSAYVLAKDPTSAYNKYRKLLDKEDICFHEDRELVSVRLAADSDLYAVITLLVL